MPHENPLKSHVRIGRPFGVEVGLHLSWFAIASLMLMSLVQRFGMLHPHWGLATVWLTAGATALLFFVALVLHELSHALVARSQGLPVHSITLFALGGIALIGWFLLGAADVSRTQLELTAKLRGARVADVMRRDCLVVEGDMRLDDFVTRHLLPTGGHAFVVTQSGSAVGLVTLHEVKPVPRARWGHTTVRQVMVPLDSLNSVSPRSPLSESVEIMGRSDEIELPVLDGGRLLGLVSRGAILRFLRTREALRL